MPALWIPSRSSVPKEEVSFGLSASGASCMAVRVVSGIFSLVLIHTSVVMECVASSSFPSRHQEKIPGQLEASFLIFHTLG